MAGSVLPYILGWEACEFHCCTMRLYWNHHFIYLKLTGSHITYICIFIVMLKYCLSISSYNCQNMAKKAFLQFSINGSSDQLIELNATLLKSITCGKPTFACSLIAMCLS